MASKEIRVRDIVSIIVRLLVWTAHGSGRSRAISRSNRRNVIATRKNFIEKGRRADPIGSKPHSYGLDFSAYVFICGIQNAISTSNDASSVLVRSVIIRLITLFRVGPKLIDWKSIVLFILKG